MSGDKITEVLSCDASIMKNVWEIRQRDYWQKIQLEEERMEKSALPTINQDWANRATAKQGSHRRERKIKPVEAQLDNDNIWKSKTQTPPGLPHGVGSAARGRPGSQSRGFSTPASNFKKGQDKNINKLQLLMFIEQTQPSAMIWGKSWKYNKSLPSPAEGSTATTDWGQCWMFAAQQPHSEEGKPWPNGPNMIDPQNLYLWKKTEHRVVESQELDLHLPAEEWEMSWRKPCKKDKEHASSVNGENVHKSGLFTSLMETQHHNEALCSSEWGESWRSTKPADQQDHFVPDDEPMTESVVNKQHKKGSSTWEESWKFINQNCNRSSSHTQKSHNPEWADSWRAAAVVSNNHKNSGLSMSQDHSDTHHDWGQHKESALHQVLSHVSHEHKHRDMHLCNESEALSEWDNSWQVAKNNTKPCEEIMKVLNALPPKVETHKVEEHPKKQHSTLEQVDPHYEQLKHTVIYHRKREFTHSNLLHQEHLENASEWMESWKIVKHRMRTARRRMRSDLSRHFRESEKEELKLNASEWKDSWKLTCKPLHQDPELWQQDWSSAPKIRVDRMKEHNHFAPIEFLKNEPTGESSWEESWKFSRHQKHDRVHHHAHKRYLRSLSDWQVAWMVSETQFHHDKPSLTQWMQAWRSAFHTENQAEQVLREHCMEELMEIQPQREKISLQKAKGKMSHSFDSHVFRERYPEEEWSTSWKTGSLLNHHEPSHHGPSGSSITPQQHTTADEHGCKWGMSFRLANPMPCVEQPWVESSPNTCHYEIICSRRKNIQHDINTNFSNNPATVKLWGTSHQFLQRASAHIKDKSMSQKSGDPWVISTRKIKRRKHLYSEIEKETQSHRKWAGCHLLGKTQPRPKRGPASVKKIKQEDEAHTKFLKEWAESWKFLVQSNGQQKQMTIKLTGWDESWKCLIPPYQVLDGTKTK